MNIRLSPVIIAAALIPNCASAAVIPDFQQTNLISNGAVPALNPPDANLRNPWGIAFTAASPFWISDNQAGVSTLYNTFGVKQGLTVTIPGAGGGMGAPTGIVNNPVGTAFNGDLFIFSGEDGVISGWRGALGTAAEVLADNSGSMAVYKGMTISVSGSNVYLLAADFHNNLIQVFKSTGAPALPGNFTDPTIPAGFAPFDIRNIGGLFYVTYAKQDAAAHDDMPGAGNGFVDVFNSDGTFNARLISHGNLDSPWGLALAPAGFGHAGGDLLVGNFGDGTINAYTLGGALVGTLADRTGTPLVNDGLWALTFGNGGNGGSVNSLYLTAGINGEADGLFARIDVIPEPGTWGLLLSGAGLLAIGGRRSRHRSRTHTGV